jgi:hypothetical protein
MLKWWLLIAFVAGISLGSMTGATAKSRIGCPATSGGSNTNDSGDNSNDNESSTNENTADTNSNGAANENGSDGSNSNENTNGSSNTNANGSANSNDNSSNSNANDNGSNSGATVNGRFAGTLTGTSTESLNGTPNQPRDRQLLPSIQFEGAYIPVVLPVLHYADSTPGGAAATENAENLTNVLLGQTQTFTYHDTGPVTLGVTVTEASYLTREFRVVVTMTFNSVSGNLTRTGTGTQTIEGSLDGNDDLVLNISTTYDIDLVAGSFSFQTGEAIVLTGTLPRQP